MSVTERQLRNQQLIETYRARREELTDGRFEGRPLLLLTTTGAKTGRRRTTPLAYTRDGEHYVVIASKGGAPTNPDWFHNLVANPEVTVEVGPRTFQARARLAQGEERDRLYAAQAALMPTFADYQEKSPRRIPVVVLEEIG